ncbi:MAG: tetratricopeptide repeat protein [Betaproteobacteria bacterium]|nr:tetratricopeptide repeat protein [Betaproteobacteria bacterium]MDE2423548.1 tetratricopeptide repeat protein [Betaproteobacteria bacterium]
MKSINHFFLTLIMLGFAVTSFAEPTIDQVYNATKTGHLAEARSMMAEVLQAHPNSAKAHFINAEVLARSGDISSARAELIVAEKLDPAQSFASARAISELKQALAVSNRAGIESSGSSGTSWGTILVVGLIALFFIIWMVRRMTQQNPVVMTQVPPGPGYYPNGMPMGGGQPPMYPGGGVGMGSGLMGSLATGAALGAGLVAGEALAHRLVDGPSGNVSGINDGMVGSQNVNSDMGGQDFGVSGTGSWDDSSGSSWDSGDAGGFDPGGGPNWS